MKKTRRAQWSSFVLGLLISGSAFANPAWLSNSNENLFERQKIETANATRDQVKAMNDATIAGLTSSLGGNFANLDRAGRARSISKENAQKLIYSIDAHPVVSTYAYSHYNRPDIEIGFCFGRATYADLAIRKLGLAEDALKKVWIIGSMTTGGLNWRYHVATLARGPQGQWFVIDNFYGEVLEINDWFERFRPTNLDGMMRLYITEAKKFGPEGGKYSPVQLGLNLSRQVDFYQSYFTDLMAWFRDHSKTATFYKDLNLSDIRKGLPPAIGAAAESETEYEPADDAETGIWWNPNHNYLVF